MATVRESITALYEQSQKSAGEGQAMFAVIESEAVSFDDAADDAAMDVAFDIPDGGRRPSIARRFDDLRDLAEREAQDIVTLAVSGAVSGAISGAISGDESPDDMLPDDAMPDDTAPADEMTDAPDNFTSGSFGATVDSPVNTVDMHTGDLQTGDIAPDISAQPPADDAEAAAAPNLPSEPPAPATGDALSDLGVADIQELVRQAWEDETALHGVANPNGGTMPEGDDDGDSGTADIGTADSGTGDVADGDFGGGDDPDIEAAMEEIAAAVVQSGDAAMPVDLAGMKAEIVAAMRAELQAVVAADLRPMIKAAIAEALQDLPPAKPAPRSKKTAAKKTSTKKAATRKATTKTARKKAPARAGKAAPASDTDISDSDVGESKAGES